MCSGLLQIRIYESVESEVLSMVFKDVVDITKEAIAQAMGTEYMDKIGDFAALKSYELVDVGKDVTDSGSVETYSKAVLSLIGKMVIDSRLYETNLPSIIVDSFEWGGYLERIYFAPTEIMDDPAYNLVAGKSYGDIEHTFYKPNVSAKIFEEAKAIMAPISLQRDQIKQSFENWEQLNTFLSGVLRSVKNTITLALKTYSHMLISSAVAVSVKATNTAVHLLTDYNAEYSLSFTEDEARHSKDFLIYCLKRMYLTRSEMTDYSTVFNNKSIPTFSTNGTLKTILLNQFIASIRFDVYPSTFDKSTLGLGEFDTINSWQGILEDGKTYTFDTVSSISIDADANNKLGIGTDAFKQSGVIGLIFDEMAIGICLHKAKVTSTYTASADFWTEFHKELLNYLLDANYNMVAFVID